MATDTADSDEEVVASLYSSIPLADTADDESPAPDDSDSRWSALAMEGIAIPACTPDVDDAPAVLEDIVNDELPAADAECAGGEEDAIAACAAPSALPYPSRDTADNLRVRRYGGRGGDPRAS